MKLVMSFIVGLCMGVALSTPARATSCNAEELSALVPGVMITGLNSVSAGGADPAYCQVQTTIPTSGGVAAGSATVVFRLPAKWNGKFLFWGVGGLGGKTYGDISANGVDQSEALSKGYATAITDTGHFGTSTDANWAQLPGGGPDTVKLFDYAYRATHDATVIGKRFVAAFYGHAITRAYFDGCSNGGRQGLAEAVRYPEDYDGIIAGAPYLDTRIIVQAAARFKALFATPGSYLPFTVLPAISNAVMARCDELDGVKDGLIQNPALCTVQPKDLVCAPGQTEGCVTATQAAFLADYIGPLRDSSGQVLVPGLSLTDLTDGGADVWTVGRTAPSNPDSAEPWGTSDPSVAPIGFQFVDSILKRIVARDAAYDYRQFPVTASGVVTTAGLGAFDAAVSGQDVGSPSGLAKYIAEKRKIILYHGLSDPWLPAFRSIQFYDQLAQADGGYTSLQRNVRLFLAPGMQHCGGGSGPNLFDTLTPLETWVEHNQAPTALYAANAQMATATRPASITRTMPLCPFPTQATYLGPTPNVMTSWSCTPNSRMLAVGEDGRLSGLSISE